MTAWQTSRLGDAITFQRGFDLPHHRRRLGRVPVVSSAGVTDWHDEALIAPPGVVTGRYGTIGGLYFVAEAYWPLNTTLFVREFRGHDPRFIFYFLQRFDFASFSGKSGVPGVNRNDLHEVVVTFPSDVAEQKAIAEALSDVDDLTASLERLIAKKRDIKTATMGQLLTGRTRLPGFTGEWERKQFGELAYIRNERVVGDARADALRCVELEHLGQGDGRLLGTTVASAGSSKYRFDEGDVLFGRLRAYLRKHWLARFSGVCSTEIWPLVPRGSLVLSSFLLFVVQAESFIEAASMAYGTHMPRADWSVVRRYSVSLPSVPEQAAIAAVLSDMDAEIEALESRLAKTRMLKQGMMQELLTGRTRLV